MVRMLLATMLVGGLIAVPNATAQDKKAKPAAKAVADPTAKIVSTLQTQRVTYEKQLNETPLMEVLQDFGKRHDLNFVIREEAFKEEGIANIRDAKLSAFVTKQEGMTVHRFLTILLQDLGAAYIIRDGYVEITTKAAAQKEVGITEAIEEAANNPDDPNALTRAQYRLNLPLLSVVAQDKPLDQVITELARAYDLNVVISPAAREQMKQIKVSERLLNVPADTMLELLASLAGFDVTRKGNTFRIGFGGAGV
jgi:type II secretory pathway component GspD/PulD (secretin)